jgi:hypothetical protein
MTVSYDDGAIVILKTNQFYLLITIVIPVL